MKPPRNDEISNLKNLLAGEMAERKALEKELRRHEERFDAFFSATPAGIAVVDSTLRYLRINETLALMNGLPVEEHVGKTIHEVMPDVARAVEPTLRQVLATGVPVFNLEIGGAASAEQGSPRKWLVSFIPLPGADGSSVGVAALVFDISDRQRLEDVMRESEAKYRMLVEHSSDAVLVFDEQGRFLEVNPRIYRMLGYTREEFMRLRVEDLVPPEDLAAMPPSYEDLRAGKTVRRTRRLLRKDGSLINVEIIGAMIGEGKMQSIVRLAPAAQSSGEASDRHRNGQMMAQFLRAIQNEGDSSPKLKLMKDLSLAFSAAVEFLERAPEREPSGELSLGRGMDFYEEVRRFEVNLIRRALQQTLGNQKQAANLLGIKHTTLHAMVKRYQIDTRDLFETVDSGAISSEPEPAS